MRTIGRPGGGPGNVLAEHRLNAAGSRPQLALGLALEKEDAPTSHAGSCTQRCLKGEGDSTIATVTGGRGRLVIGVAQRRSPVIVKTSAYISSNHK